MLWRVTILHQIRQLEETLPDFVNTTANDSTRAISGKKDDLGQDAAQSVEDWELV